MKDCTHWWQRALFYEVAAASFQDSNDDGRGDLGGLLRRVDYLKWLGVDAVWLTPVQPTPFRDLGYDITDFCAIDPAMGTLEDRLVETLHGAGMRLILDFVPNHTSDEHAWFVDACTSRTICHRDWYLWADAAPDGGGRQGYRDGYEAVRRRLRPARPRPCASTAMARCWRCLTSRRIRGAETTRCMAAGSSRPISTATTMPRLWAPCCCVGRKAC
jgi:hypothetical protein